MRKRGDRQFSDERILGGGEFVESVMGEIGVAQKEMLPMRLRIADAEEQLKYHCDKSGLTQAALQAGCRSREYSALRAVLARKFVTEMGMSHANVARIIGISRVGVSQLFRR